MPRLHVAVNKGGFAHGRNCDARPASFQIQIGGCVITIYAQIGVVFSLILKSQHSRFKISIGITFDTVLKKILDQQLVTQERFVLAPVTGVEIAMPYSVR